MHHLLSTRYLRLPALVLLVCAFALTGCDSNDDDGDDLDIDGTWEAQSTTVSISGFPPFEETYDEDEFVFEISDGEITSYQLDDFASVACYEVETETFESLGGNRYSSTFLDEGVEQTMEFTLSANDGELVLEADDVEFSLDGETTASADIELVATRTNTDLGDLTPLCD